MSVLSKNQINFIRENLPGRLKIIELPGDASSRKYLRIMNSDKNYIICIDENLKNTSPGNFPFFCTHKLLSKNKINVPQIYQFDSQNGLILLEDLGNILLENYLPGKSSAEIYKIYIQIIDDLIKIQSIPKGKDLPFTMAFDTEKLNYEFNFFIENYIFNYLKLDINSRNLSLIKKEFQRICQILDKPGLFVLNHRDFHARNIMLKNRGLVYIDFQDARLGLPHYDLVSLLRDSYYVLEEKLHEKLKTYYYNKSIEKKIHELSENSFDYYYYLMAFQRNIKALGSFGYLISVKNKKHYKNSIDTTLNYFNNYAFKSPELKNIYKLLQQAGILKP